LDVKVDEINHMPNPQPVDEIPHNSAEDQAEGDLAEEGARVKLMAAEEQHQQREEGDAGQQPVVATEKAPRRARVSPMDEPEETLNYDPLLSWLGEEQEHHVLGDLIECNHQHSDQRNAAIRRPVERV
jgi:hypothetical protein